MGSELADAATSGTENAATTIPKLAVLCNNIPQEYHCKLKTAISLIVNRSLSVTVAPQANLFSIRRIASSERD